MARLCLLGLTAFRVKIHYTVDRYGNTGGASVPITLADALAQGRVKEGDHVLLAAIGGGMTWGGVFMRWGCGGIGVDHAPGSEHPLPLIRS